MACHDTKIREFSAPYYS